MPKRLFHRLYSLSDTFRGRFFYYYSRGVVHSSQRRSRLQVALTGGLFCFTRHQEERNHPSTMPEPAFVRSEDGADPGRTRKQLSLSLIGTALYTQNLIHTRVAIEHL